MLNAGALDPAAALHPLRVKGCHLRWWGDSVPRSPLACCATLLLGGGSEEFRHFRAEGFNLLLFGSLHDLDHAQGHGLIPRLHDLDVRHAVNLEALLRELPHDCAGRGNEIMLALRAERREPCLATGLSLHEFRNCGCATPTSLDVGFNAGLHRGVIDRDCGYGCERG